MNWEVIDKKWSYIYTDYNGKVWLSTRKPYLQEGFVQHYWEGRGIITELSPPDLLVGYKVNYKAYGWKKSLIGRN